MCHLYHRCKASFYSHESLAGHIAREHEKYACGECEKAFRNKTMLTVHVKAVHLKIRPYQCKLCQRLFAKMENLDIHIAVLHLGYKVIALHWSEITTYK